MHACWRDPDCRQFGVIYRLYLNTPRGGLIIAFRRDSWVQVWLPFAGYRERWVPIAWHPAAR